MISNDEYSYNGSSLLIFNSTNAKQIVFHCVLFKKALSLLTRLDQYHQIPAKLRCNFQLNWSWQVVQ